MPETETPRGGEADRYWVLWPCGCAVATRFEIAGHQCPPAAGRGDTDSSGEVIEPGLSPEANGRRLAWFTDDELATELARRRALGGPL